MIETISQGSGYVEDKNSNVTTTERSTLLLNVEETTELIVDYKLSGFLDV